MAEATLVLEEERDGRLVFRVEADPFGAPPFAGPPGRTWDAFVVHGPGAATYQWRTGADRERDRAKRLVRRGLLEDEVHGAFRGSEYLQRLDEYVEEWAEEDEEPALEDELARYRYVLEGLASGAFDPAESDSTWSYYDFEDDTHLGDAAEALERPPGVEIDERDDGGPGSGYTARMLVLAPGQTLADYAAWLAARPVKKPR